MVYSFSFLFPLNFPLPLVKHLKDLWFCLKMKVDNCKAISNSPGQLKANTKSVFGQMALITHICRYSQLPLASKKQVL